MFCQKCTDAGWDVEHFSTIFAKLFASETSIKSTVSLFIVVWGKNLFEATRKSRGMFFRQFLYIFTFPRAGNPVYSIQSAYMN